MRSQPVIVICSTFTAEPLTEFLLYWLNVFKTHTRVEFAPYGQVLQTLLDSRSHFAQNTAGLNVILLRFEDWSRFRENAGGGGSGREFHAKLLNCELIAALKAAASTSGSPLLVCVCPPSPAAILDPAESVLLRELEADLAQALRDVPSVQFLSAARLAELYPVARTYDATGDRLGHVPYIPEFYAALATAIARFFHASTREPAKVIVVDCDNTLWRGICGERGAEGVKIDAASHALQTFLKSKQDDGMLLCVCSKNSPEDVEQTFAQHPRMPLKRSDFVGWRVNWQRKSENIQSLSKELSLGLDSFIFLDDNPMETAEVEAHCAGVLAVTLPVALDQIPHFLEHLWAFDRNYVTAEDRKRTALYRENAIRNQALAESFSLSDFLAGLKLEIEIRALQGPSEIERAAQMTQRTNQFNLTTRRYTEPGIRQLLSDPAVQVLTMFVRDRYGDYGQAGLSIHEVRGGALCLRDFLLSCRVLGKGVEHKVVAWLGAIALAQSLTTVEMQLQRAGDHTRRAQRPVGNAAYPPLGTRAARLPHRYSR